jgi:predicted small lipoprotein YifL
MSLSRRTLLIVPLCALALLPGCGRKGPLYLPPPPPAGSGPVEQAPPPVAQPTPPSAQPDR